MKIEYNVPCPPVSDPRIRKDYIPLYNQIFYYMHNDEKELVLNCDTPRAFKCNLLMSQARYGKFIISTSKKKKEVRVFSCEKV